MGEREERTSQNIKLCPKNYCVLSRLTCLFKSIFRNYLYKQASKAYSALIAENHDKTRYFEIQII